MPGNEVAHALSTTFAEAAGVDGKQKWGLVLSSSARVTQMTYQTVIGVRYPELVSTSPTGCSFGRFVSPDEDLQGGFLPVFWDLPWASQPTCGCGHWCRGGLAPIPIQVLP